MQPKTVSVLGFGSWGISLACLLAENGHRVSAWDSNEKYLSEMAHTRRNKFLPGVVVPVEVEIASDVRDAEVYIVAQPSSRVGDVRGLPTGAVIACTTKGFSGGRRISSVLAELNPGCPVVALTGPTHAEEVSRGIPTAIVAASENPAAAELVQEIFTNERFRVYTTCDIAGAELGGALKNVIAVAAGISDGLGFGDNTKAALITRGMSEITRLGVAMGANEHTFAGLSGMGDLIVTCTSVHSRNWRCGNALAQGKSLDEALAEIGMVVEGAQTAQAALALADAHGVEMPIVAEVNRVLFEGKNPRAAVTDLMLRQPKGE